MNPRQPLAANFDQHDRAVGHHDRPFRKFEFGGENANIGHANPPDFLAASSWLQASLSALMAKWRRLAKQSRLAARLHCKAGNIDIVLAGNDFPIVHTARAFDPTAQQAAQQE
jgi:hypothetical protein